MFKSISLVITVTIFGSVVWANRLFEPNSPLVKQAAIAVRRQLGLSNQTPIKVVIVGGSKGIGRGFAEFSLAMGSEVLIVSRENAPRTASELQKDYQNIGAISAYTADFSDLSDVARFETEQAAFLQEAHIVISSAGTIVRDDAPSDQVAAARTIKSQATVLFHKHMAEIFKKRKPESGALYKGIILPVSSMSGLFEFPEPYATFYQTSADLIASAQDLHRASGGSILSVAIAHGLTDTDVLKRDARIPSVAIRRWGDTVKSLISDVATKLFLSSAFQQATVPDNVLIPGNPFNLKLWGAFLTAKTLLPREQREAWYKSMFVLADQYKGSSDELIQIQMASLEAMLDAQSNIGTILDNPLGRLGCSAAVGATKFFSKIWGK